MRTLLISLGILLLSSSVPLVAQEAETRPPQTLVADSLIVVEEEALTESLVRLVQARRQQRQKAEVAEWTETLELMKLAWLFDLLSAPPASQPNAQPATALSSSDSQLEARLLHLERTIALLAPTSSRPIQTATSSTTTTQTSEHRSIDNKRLDSLERQLASLRQELKAARRQEPASQAPLVPLTLLALGADSASASENPVAPASELVEHTSQGDTVVIEHTNQVERTEQVVVDFKRSVYFPAGLAILDARAEATLAETAAFLLAYPTARVSLSGYASSEGSLATNQRLSHSRLQAVVLYLRQAGIAPERFVVAHTGIDLGTLARPLSRRVDITLVR